MDRFRSGKSLSPLRQAEAYWTSLRKNGDVPKRSDIDPRGIESLLEYAFILERIAPGIARFRLAGQHLSGLMGMDVRGMPLTAFFNTQARNDIAATLEHVFDSPAVAEVSMVGQPRRPGRLPAEARMLILPLRSDTGEVSRALGILISENSIHDVPARFDIAGCSVRPVNREPARRPVARKPAKKPMAYPVPEDQTRAKKPGLSEPARPKVKGRPSYLRVVK